MAEYYADISAIGNEYQAYTDTPTTWAVPQDGNGKAGPGHAAAVAIASIDFTGVSAAGAGQVSLLGVTASSTLNASGAALATAVASAINGSGTAVSATYSALLLPLNRLVYARVDPGQDTRVQVMLRIAGADWNGMTIAHAGLTGTPTVVAFASGADGPYAYLYNTSTVFGKADNQASGSTGPQYGIFFNAAAGVANPGTTDLVHLRTRRGGSDLTAAEYSLTTTSLTTFTWQARNYLADNGTVWSGDNGTLTVTFRRNMSASTAASINLPSGGYVSFTSRAKYNLNIVAGSTNGSGALSVFVATAASSSVAAIRCKMTEHASHLTAATLNWCLMNTGVTGIKVDYSESLFQFRGVTTSRNLLNAAASTVAYAARLFGTSVEVIAATSSIGAFFTHGSAQGAGPNLIEWVGGAVYDSNGVYSCANPFNIDGTLGTQAIIVDSVAGITDPSLNFTTGGTSSHSLSGYLRWVNPEGPNKAFRYITNRFTVDWKGDGTFPYANAAADLRGVNWSHRLTWNNTPHPLTGTECLRLSYFYRGAAAVKAVKVCMYVPDATTIKQDEIGGTVQYIDSSDIRRTEPIGALSILQYATSRAADLVSDTSTWVANGVASHSAKKLEVTTSQPVKSGSEIVVVLVLRKAQSPSITLYVSPELVLS